MLSVLRGEGSAAEIARRHQVSDVTLAKWRDTFLAGGRDALANGSRRASGWRDFKGAAVAVLLVVLCGISDEVHQSFVPERDASLVDVGLDPVGALIGTTVGVRSNPPSAIRRQTR